MISDYTVVNVLQNKGQMGGKSEIKKIEKNNEKRIN